MRRAGSVLAALTVAVAALTGCSTGSSPAVDTTVVATRTQTQPPVTVSPTRPPAFALALTATPDQPPGSTLPAGETEASCPYIRAGLNIEPAKGSEPTFADIEGNRVQRVTTLSTLQPAGCRFFFFGDYHATGDILPSTYATAVEARNTMIVTAEAGTQAQGVPSFAPGVDGVSFRTTLNPGDGGQDWAFAFAKGTVMVVVRTDQNDTSNNARLLAAAIVDQF